ncbi:MAG: hypothetical protein IPM21_11990 [Acidobacteria bacterium]|nr:hypothetical protein [Acidobacteriota bacterium]
MPTLPVRDSSDALIYVVVDPANQVFEDNPGGPAETNNTTSVPTRFEYRVPDLQVQSVTPPTEVDSDTQFALQWTTINTGLRASNPMWERVFFSTDNQVGGDVLLGEFLLNQPIAAGESINRVQNVTIPTNSISATGDYFVYVQTDAFSNVNEGANENNNVTFSPSGYAGFFGPIWRSRTLPLRRLPSSIKRYRSSGPFPTTAPARPTLRTGPTGSTSAQTRRSTPQRRLQRHLIQAFSMQARVMSHRRPCASLGESPETIK